MGCQNMQIGYAKVSQMREIPKWVGSSSFQRICDTCVSYRNLKTGGWNEIRPNPDHFTTGAKCSDAWLKTNKPKESHTTKSKDSESEDTTRRRLIALEKQI